MKILVLQLARHGDIVQSWPVMRSLRRHYPKATIHFMVRELYAEAAMNLPEVDQVWPMSSAQILEQVYSEGEVDKSLHEVGTMLGTLKRESYDKVINLSFSPLSSHIVHAVSTEQTSVRGYTRFDDGYLNLPDDASAYFYAQVGVGRFSRVHLTEMFAAVADVELSAEDVDFKQTVSKSNLLPLNQDYVVVHLGASQVEKSYSSEMWSSAISEFRSKDRAAIVFVGSGGELDLYNKMQLPESASFINLIGKTSFSELASVISNAQLVVGADSLPMQLASMLNVRSLNISFSSVNFWETGPLAEGSRVIWEIKPERLIPSRLASEMRAMLIGNRTPWPVIYREQQGFSSYLPSGYEFTSFEWDLIQALYLEKDFPILSDGLVLLGMERLFEAVTLAIEQYPNVMDEKKRSSAMAIVAEVDSIITTIERMVPSLQPLISWFQTERIRIGPGDLPVVMEKTLEIFKRMRLVLAVYMKDVIDEQGADVDDGSQRKNQFVED